MFPSMPDPRGAGWCTLRATGRPAKQQWHLARATAAIQVIPAVQCQGGCMAAAAAGTSIRLTHFKSPRQAEGTFARRREWWPRPLQGGRQACVGWVCVEAVAMAVRGGVTGRQEHRPQQKRVDQSSVHWQSHFAGLCRLSLPHSPRFHYHRGVALGWWVVTLV